MFDLRKKGVLITGGTGSEQGSCFASNAIETVVDGEVFIPKVARLRMIGLAGAIAPDCDNQAIEIRPGERLRALLFSEYGSRYLVELTDRFAIQPKHPSLKDRPQPAGKTLPEGFHYDGDRNTEWLSGRELLEMACELGRVEAAHAQC